MSIEDKELDEMFHGEEQPLHPDTVHITMGKPAPKKEAPKPKSKDIPVAAQWEPEKPAPNAMDKLKACAKSGLLYGGLTFLIFYWNQAGLMASSIAVPSMCICTAMVGLAWGKASMGGK
jgi:hypothetical protein